MSKKAFENFKLNLNLISQNAKGFRPVSKPDKLKRQIYTSKEYQATPKDLKLALSANYTKFSPNALKEALKPYFQLYSIVENLDKIPTVYKESAKFASKLIWKQKSGYLSNYLNNAGISKTYLLPNGEIKDEFLEHLISLPSRKNSHIFMFSDLNEIFIKAEKKIEKIKFDVFKSQDKDKDPIKIKMLVSFDYAGKKHLGLLETHFHPQETQLRTHFSLIVNGRGTGIHNLTRLDSNGYLDKDFIVKNNKQEFFKYIDEKDLATFNENYGHKNIYSGSTNSQYKKEFGEFAKSSAHMHYVDNNFETARALLLMNGLINQNKSSLKTLNYTRTKFNAKDVEFYDDEKLKYNDLIKYKAMLPARQFLNYSFNSLNIDYSNLQNYDKLCNAIDSFRVKDVPGNNHQKFDIEYFNKLFDLTAEQEKHTQQ